MSAGYEWEPMGEARTSVPVFPPHTHHTSQNLLQYLALSTSTARGRGEQMATPTHTLAEINALDQEAFTALLGGLFEHSPWIAEAGWHARPFASVEALHGALCAVMYDADPEQQVALIQAHPDLVGRAARAGTLTA